jgi:mRNA interferase HigB
MVFQYLEHINKIGLTLSSMRIVAKGTLIDFWKKYPDSKIGLLTWHDRMKKARYDHTQQIIKDFKGADYVGNNRIVFNIAKNKFRLVVSFRYEFKSCWIKFVGTHTEYDKIDPKTIEF